MMGVLQLKADHAGEVVPHHDSILTEALRLASSGFPIFPVHQHDKRPATGVGGFKLASTNTAQISAWWAQNQNYMIGLRTGEASGLAVLDLDVKTDPETGEVMLDGGAILQGIMERNGLALPDTVKVRTPRGGQHLYFRHEPGFKSRANDKVGIDCRCEGGYVVCPPSMRADGEAYFFENPLGLFEIAKAPDWLAEFFRTGYLPGLIERKLPSDTVSEHSGERRGGKALPEPYDHPAAAGSGSRREDLERALAGYWNPDLYDDWTEAALALHGFPNGLEIWLAWASRSDKFNRAENLRKWDQTVPVTKISEKSILHRVERETLSEWGREHAARISAATPLYGRSAPASISPQALWDPWREVAVPAFPLDVLPHDIAEYVEARGTETGACRSAIAMCCIAAASGALSHEARLYLKPGKNFGVTPRLWVLLVGDPSAKKSPAIDGAVRPLMLHQKSEHASALAAWREKVAAAEGKAKKDVPKPDLTHYAINDTTPEMLAEVLSRQPRGTLVIADELAGWLGALDRYGSGKGASSGRAIWLQAYNGGPFTLLRVTRETLPVDNLSSSILGGIQPERLREIGSLTSDGLLQRFLPVMMAKPEIDRDGFSGTAFRAWDDRVRSLLSYSRFSTELAGEAREERNRMAGILFDLGQIDSEGAGWKGFVGKLPGVWGSVALLLHVLWGYRASDPVSAETAKRASHLLETFILPHGLGFYRSLAGNVQADSRAIAGFLAGWDQPVISVRDFVRGPRCCRGLSPEDLVAKLAPFETGGWLEPEKPGPWNRKWKITPGIASRFADELARHKAAIAVIQAKISGARGDE